MTDPALAEAFEATWPAAEYADAGGFRIGRAQGAGRRVNSACTVRSWSPADIDDVLRIQSDWRQAAAFRVLDDETRLIAALTDRGFQRATPTVVIQADVSALTDRRIPPVMAFAVWPPLAIQRDIWVAGEIGAERQAVMHRVAGPKAALLGRIEDRAAGAGFVAIHSGVAMVHGIEILPDWRRKGLAGWMMRRAAVWARENGADRLALAVTRANAPAIALYRGLGFSDAGGYAYFVKP